MRGLFLRRRFCGFGPSGLKEPGESPALHCIRARRASALRILVRQRLRRQPGVYGMVDTQGELTYVGKAKFLRTRLLSYFRVKSRDPKAGRVLAHARSLVWEYAPNEFAALLRELELIRRWRPRFNVQGQPGRLRPIYVCLGRQPAPHVFLSRRPPGGALAIFGPIRAGRRAAEAVRRLNDWFQLRDCPRAQEMVFADQPELFPTRRTPGCLRVEIGTCLGPCAAGCSRRDYMVQVRRAEAFLQGKDLTPLESLRAKMAAASAATAFEQAAVLRDQWQVLRWLHDNLARLSVIRAEQSFVYPVTGPDGPEFWYLVHGGRVRAEVAAPEDAATRRAAQRAIARTYSHGQTAVRPLPPEEIDHVHLVAGWFRRHPDERLRLLSPQQALAACQPCAV